MPFGSKVFGTKVEVKNLNSIANVKAALDYEIQRQSEILLSGGKIDQETRRYDEGLKQTILMRKKTSAIDYKYFREPNILPIDLTEEFIQDAISHMEKLPSSYRQELSKIGLSSYEIEEVLRNKEFVLYFEKTLKEGAKNPKTLWNLLMVDILAYLNKNEITLNELKFDNKKLAKLINLLEDKKINSKQGKQVLEEMLNTGLDPEEITAKLGLAQISDLSEIQKIVDEVIKNNQQSVSDYKAGKDRALGFIVGQVMKASHGKANPSLAKELVLKALA